MNIFFVESPFQLLCAYEASQVFGDGKFVIRLTKQKRSDRQLSFLVDYLQIRNYEFFILPPHEKNYFQILKTVKFIISSVIYFKQIFIGNYESGFFKMIMRGIPKKKIILLDDGAKTLFIQNQVFRPGNALDMYTFFDISPYQNQKIYKNDFRHLSSMMRENLTIGNELIFIGSKLSEVGLMEEGTYIDIVKQIKQTFHMPIKYIVHRGESEEKLQKIKALHIQVVELEYPVELYGIMNTYMPGQVISFYSTALLSLYYLYPVDIYSIEYSFSHPAIREVYSYIEKTDIKKVRV